VSKPWQSYALHILDAIAKVRRIRERGDITQASRWPPKVCHLWPSQTAPPRGVHPPKRCDRRVNPHD
jgi:hypothetical protein